MGQFASEVGGWEDREIQGTRWEGGSGWTEVWMLHKYTEAIPVVGELGIGMIVNSKSKTLISTFFQYENLKI